jgi:protein-disulfide isomerase
MLTRRTFAALLLALGLPFAALAHPGHANAADPLPDIVLGEEDAPVTVIEYASMTCPHCASFHQTTFKELKAEYIDTGKVKFVLREFPFDPLAAAVFMLARCSGEERYYDVVDLFFETQDQWAVREGALGEIRKIAKQAGFTNAQFETCLKDQELLDGINAVKQHGYEEFNVTATPTILIDGEKLEGARNMSAFREIIDPKLGG